VDDEMKKRAEALAELLREQGKDEHAGKLATTAQAIGRGAERAVFATLLGIVDVVLDAAESIDPRTQAMAEELRIIVEAHLTTGQTNPR
jgi:hypothetical protein